MFHYLLQHPQMVALAKDSVALGGKEVRFFNRQHPSSSSSAAEEEENTLTLDRYITPNFAPMQAWSTDNRNQFQRGKRLVTGESTPDYLRAPEGMSCRGVAWCDVAWRALVNGGRSSTDWMTPTDTAPHPHPLLLPTPIRNNPSIVPSRIKALLPDVKVSDTSGACCGISTDHPFPRLLTPYPDCLSVPPHSPLLARPCPPTR